MRITRATDYAVRVMMRLAVNPDSGRMTQIELAEQAGVPAQFLGKVLQSLVKAGLAHSHRGVLGGFELARPSAEINLLQIVEAIDGPIQLEARFALASPGRPTETDPAAQVWRRAAQAMAAVLRDAALDDLIRSSAAPPVYSDVEPILDDDVTPDAARLISLPVEAGIASSVTQCRAVQPRSARTRSRRSSRMAAISSTFSARTPPESLASIRLIEVSSVWRRRSIEAGVVGVEALGAAGLGAGAAAAAAPDRLAGAAAVFTGAGLTAGAAASCLRAYSSSRA